MVKKSIAIGVVVAFVLSLIRGEVTDSFTTLAIFGLTGFFASFFLFWLFGDTRLSTLETSLATLPQTTMARNALSITIVLTILIWSGSFIQGGGYAGWILFLLVSFLTPLAVCILVPRFPIAVGVFTATCITCSLLIAEYRWEAERGNAEFLVNFLEREAISYIVIWLVASVLSLLTSVPIHIKRRLPVDGSKRLENASRPQFDKTPLSRSALKISAIVTIPILMLFSANRIDNKLSGLREEYLEKYNKHIAAVGELVEAEHGKPITTLSELTKLEKEYALKHPKITWHREMSKKYWKAFNCPTIDHRNNMHSASAHRVG